MNLCLYIVGYLLGLAFLFVVNFGNMETNKKRYAIHAKVFLRPKLPKAGILNLLYSPLWLSFLMYIEYIFTPPNIFLGANFCHLGNFFEKIIILNNIFFSK
jgi:hypothetical protein